MQRLTLKIENEEARSLGAASEFTVDRDEVSLGRKAGNDWVLPDNTRFISGRHVTIKRDAAGFTLTDLSTNGTFLNGQATRLSGPHVLRDGDRVKLGPYILAAALEEVAPPRASAHAPARPGRS